MSGHQGQANNNQGRGNSQGVYDPRYASNAYGYQTHPSDTQYYSQEGGETASGSGGYINQSSIGITEPDSCVTVPLTPKGFSERFLPSAGTTLRYMPIDAFTGIPKAFPDTTLTHPSDTQYYDQGGGETASGSGGDIYQTHPSDTQYYYQGGGGGTASGSGGYNVAGSDTGTASKPDDNSYYPQGDQISYQKPPATLYDPRHPGSIITMPTADCVNWNDTFGVTCPRPGVTITCISQWRRTKIPQDPAHKHPNTVPALSRTIDRNVNAGATATRQFRNVKTFFEEVEKELDEYARAEDKVGQWIGWICGSCYVEGQECDNTGSLPDQPCMRCFMHGLPFCYYIETLPNEASNWRPRPGEKSRHNYANKLSNRERRAKKGEESRKAADGVLKAG